MAGVGWTLHSRGPDQVPKPYVLRNGPGFLRVDPGFLPLYHFRTFFLSSSFRTHGELGTFVATLFITCMCRKTSGSLEPGARGVETMSLYVYGVPTVYRPCVAVSLASCARKGDDRGGQELITLTEMRTTGDLQTNHLW